MYTDRSHSRYTAVQIRSQIKTEKNTYMTDNFRRFKLQCRGHITLHAYI